MTKKEIVKTISEEIGLTQLKTKEIVQKTFDAIVERDTGAEIHPEALYWQGVAGFMAGRQDWGALGRSWKRVAEKYPGNRFGTHASVIEDAP